jgi:hypothetical protein
MRASPIAAARCDFPPPGGPNSRIGALCEPAVAGGHGHDLRLRHHGYGVEGEAVERLSGRQMGFGQMTFDPAPIAFGQFMFGNGRQEAGRRPSFTIGLLGKLRPQGLDRRQSEFIEHDAEASLIDVDVLHATSPAWAVPIRAS